MRSTGLFTGSILAAIAASLCCIGPVVLALTGVGSMALFSRFEAVRPYLLGLSIVFLTAGLYWAWRNRRTACAPGGSCESKSLRAWLLLLVPVVAVAASAAFPYYSSAWVKGTSTKVAAETMPSGQVKTVGFRISGMTCESCASGLAASFRNLPGVKDAVVEYPSGNTSITLDPAKVSVDQLAALVREAGYQFVP